MAHRAHGPHRSSSVESYLRESRVAAAVAVLALAGGVVSDVLARGFWSRHGLLAGLASSVIVVMLSLALVNELVERRRRRRWSVLAQYVMLQLVRNARLTWTGLMDLAGLMPPPPYTADSIDTGAQLVLDTPRLTQSVRDLVAHPDRRELMHQRIGRLVAHSDELLGRWAGVMLTADAYAEIIDRHVELVSDLAWLGSLLDHFEPADDDAQAKGASHPAVEIEGDLDDDQLTTRIVAIAQLAAGLDRTTLELATRLVPIEWWATRLGASTPDPSAYTMLSRSRAPLS